MENEAKFGTQVVTISEEIKVVGLSLRASGLPMRFDSLGKLWERYGETRRGRVADAAKPLMEYGVCINTQPDYLTGCAVERLGETGEGLMSMTIPAGRYVKDSFAAGSFDELVGPSLKSRDPHKWAKDNGVALDERLYIEVYPRESFDRGAYEMYTLTPVASGEGE